MSEYLLSKFWRGTLTLLNEMSALSTPFRPIRWPMSFTVHPGRHLPATPSRIGTKIAWTPSFTPPTISCAKTTQCWAWSAPFVIQYLCESSLSKRFKTRYLKLWLWRGVLLGHYVRLDGRLTRTSWNNASSIINAWWNNKWNIDQEVNISDIIKLYSDINYVT